jgi:hypothetical protein
MLACLSGLSLHIVGLERWTCFERPQPAVLVSSHDGDVTVVAVIDDLRILLRTSRKVTGQDSPEVELRKESGT